MGNKPSSGKEPSDPLSSKKEEMRQPSPPEKKPSYSRFGREKMEQKPPSESRFEMEGPNQLPLGPIEMTKRQFQKNVVPFSEEIGRGQFGKVSHFQLAFKEIDLNIDPKEKEKIIELTKTEIMTLRKIRDGMNSPEFIVQYFGFFRISDITLEKYVIVTEFIKGVNLEDYLRVLKSPVSGNPKYARGTPERFHYFVDFAYNMAVVLAELHANGIAHRDLHTRNIMISTKGNVVAEGRGDLYYHLDNSEKMKFMDLYKVEYYDPNEYNPSTKFTQFIKLLSKNELANNFKIIDFGLSCFADNCRPTTFYMQIGPPEMGFGKYDAKKLDVWMFAMLMQKIIHEDFGGYEGYSFNEKIRGAELKYAMYDTFLKNYTSVYSSSNPMQKLMTDILTQDVKIKDTERMSMNEVVERFEDEINPFFTEKESKEEEFRSDVTGPAERSILTSETPKYTPLKSTYSESTHSDYAPLDFLSELDQEGKKTKEKQTINGMFILRRNGKECLLNKERTHRICNHIFEIGSLSVSTSRCPKCIAKNLK